MQLYVGVQRGNHARELLKIKWNLKIILYYTFIIIIHVEVFPLIWLAIRLWQNVSQVFLLAFHTKPFGSAAAASVFLCGETKNRSISKVHYNLMGGKKDKENGPPPPPVLFIFLWWFSSFWRDRETRWAEVMASYIAAVPAVVKREREKEPADLFNLDQCQGWKDSGKWRPFQQRGQSSFFFFFLFILLSAGHFCSLIGS